MDGGDEDGGQNVIGSIPAGEVGVIKVGAGNSHVSGVVEDVEVTDVVGAVGPELVVHHERGFPPARGGVP